MDLARGAPRRSCYRCADIMAQLVSGSLHTKRALRRSRAISLRFEVPYAVEVWERVAVGFSAPSSIIPWSGREGDVQQKKGSNGLVAWN